jgi:hypothetical protein
MKKKSLLKSICLLLCLTASLSACSSQQIASLLSNAPLSPSEIASGLREALIQGVKKGLVSLMAQDGFFNNSLVRIPFPPETQKVADRLSQLGLQSEVNKFVRTLNAGASEACKEAEPIFVNAIKSMTIQDAMGILKGKEDEATQYLKRTTEESLVSLFKPVIKRNLDKVNATRLYGDLVSRYNQIPLVQKVNPDLDDYATRAAVDGVFKMIAQEEAKIRRDPVARTTELLKRVFAQAPQNQ